MSSDTQVDESVELQKLNLSVEIKNVSACQRHVRVSVSREDIDRYFQKQFDEIVPKAEIPGFRAGKAPRKLIESKFRKQIESQVKGSLLMDSLAQVNTERHFSAISEPDLNYEKVNIPESGPMTYEFDIEVRPEFDLPQWEGLTINRPEREFSDADIQAYCALLGNDRGDVVPVEGPIMLNDEVAFRIVASLDGSVVATHEDILISVRPNLVFADGVISGFDTLAVGKTAGAKFTTQYLVKANAGKEEFRGKTLELEFEVLDVRRVEPLSIEELSNEFDIADVDEFKETVLKSLKRQLAYEQRQVVRGQISALLTESANWALPPDLLKRQFRRELSRYVMELQSSGFSDDEIRHRENLARHDLMARTEVLLKEHFILERIAEEKQIEDDPLDYDLAIAQIAASTNESPRRVRARYEKNGQIDALRNMIIEGKVIDMIIAAANIKATPYELPSSSTTEAIELAISGDDEADIPEAKFDVQPDAPIPGVTNKKD